MPEEILPTAPESAPGEFAYHYHPPVGIDSGITLVLLHGTGGDEHSLVGLARDVAPSAALLALRGPVSENGRNRFFRRTAAGHFDEGDLRRRAAEFGLRLRELVERHGRSRNRVVLFGYSNGANLAAASLLLEEAEAAGAVLLRPMVTVAPDPLPALGSLRVFLSGGLVDDTVRREETDRLGGLFGASGASTVVYWARAGHEIVAEELTAVRRFLGDLEGDAPNLEGDAP